MFKFRRRSVDLKNVEPTTPLPKSLSTNSLLLTLETPPEKSTPAYKNFEPEVQREFERNFDYNKSNKKKRSKDFKKVVNGDEESRERFVLDIGEPPTLSPIPPHLLLTDLTIPPSPPQIDSKKKKSKDMRKLVALAKKGKPPPTNLTTTISEILKTLDPRPPQQMTSSELTYEKTKMQRHLLLLEKKHGRALLKEEKEIVRPLYERYRLIKKINLVTIEEGVALEVVEQDDNEEVDEEEREEVEEEQETRGENFFEEMELTTLLSILTQKKEEKRRLRKLLHIFESDFQNATGRKASKEDKKKAMDVRYEEYKRIKAEVRLLEVLKKKVVG